MAGDRPQMFPLMLDVTAAPIFLIGGSAGLTARLDAMESYGARTIHIFCEQPADDFAARAGARLQTRWPAIADFESLKPRVVFVADVDDALAAGWRDMAHTAGAFVHVQDRIPLCDFHLPAILRRGRLQVSVSTDGIAPGLARVLRDYLGERVFGPEWAGRVEEIAVARDKWRGQGLTMATLGSAIVDYIKSRGWLGSR